MRFDSGPKPMNWKDRPVVVTGGASFIGSHLVEGLVDRGAAVRVVDDLSSGSLENIREHLAAGRVELTRGTLKEPGVTRKALDGTSVVSHSAAGHGAAVTWSCTSRRAPSTRCSTSSCSTRWPGPGSTT